MSEEVTWEAKPHKATEPNEVLNHSECPLATMRLKDTSQCYSDPSQRNFGNVDFWSFFSNLRA